MQKHIFPPIFICIYTKNFEKDAFYDNGYRKAQRPAVGTVYRCAGGNMRDLSHGKKRIYPVSSAENAERQRKKPFGSRDLCSCRFIGNGKYNRLRRSYCRRGTGGSVLDVGIRFCRNGACLLGKQAGRRVRGKISVRRKGTYALH